MSDRAMRDRFADLPALDFPDPAFVTPPTLSEARVALVTTAALRADGSGQWVDDPAGFTVLPISAEADLRLTHYSSNFDRAAFSADHNVVFPVDRLRELADRGTIGSVAKHHISFLGAQREAGLEAIRIDSGPAAARVLRADDVDVVLLTPV